jgi:dTDP-glucose 4,6-dehydratase
VEGFYLSRKQYEEALWPIPHYYIHLAPIAPTEVICFSRRYGGRILLASSGAVYDQDTEYAENKRRWERQLLDASDLNVVIARLFTFYGEKLDGNKAITQFIRSAREGKMLRIWGDGNTVRSYMHGAEMGKWLWAILFKGQNGEAYDVGADKPVTMLELARMVASNYKPKPPILIENGEDRAPVYLPKDTAKTRRLLNG